MNYLLTLKGVLLLSFLVLSENIFSQDTKSSYVKSIDEYVEKYVATHEAVKAGDRQFLHFFPADSSFSVIATFTKIVDNIGFSMLTSQQASRQYYRYGKINFIINGTGCELTVYQSKDLILTHEFKNYLFIPFTDATNGTDTYEGGRYIDLVIADIEVDKVKIDFNKAYNPYCCYTTGYHCPIPPKENALAIAINVGEMKYTKSVH